jgi:uncharacterized protein YqjF (DUF2071 family)
MLNYEVDRSVVAPLVPARTEIDAWDGRTYVSVVGFLFLDTRVLGLPIPFHRHFEEVNLRFYVRHKAAEGWRRGVVFVKEMVPRAAIAFVARTLYNENYVAMPMAHALTETAVRVERAAYSWNSGGRKHSMAVAIGSDPQAPVPGSQEEFIAEHYWGYTAQRDGGTVEYHVQHLPWKVARATHAELDCDVRQVYGEAFVEPLQARPASAFLADGSAVTVSRGVRLGVGR